MSHSILFFSRLIIYGNKTYMKCVLYSNGCRARITFMDGELITPVPYHPTHDVQHSETYVHVSKQSLKKNAAQTDHPTKRLVAQAVCGNGMNYETRSKLNCQIRFMGKMARESRRIAHSYPTIYSPRTLELIAIPCTKYCAASSSRKSVSVAMQCMSLYSVCHHTVY